MRPPFFPSRSPVQPQPLHLTAWTFCISCRHAVRADGSSRVACRSPTATRAISVRIFPFWGPWRNTQILRPTCWHPLHSIAIPCRFLPTSSHGRRQPPCAHDRDGRLSGTRSAGVRRVCPPPSLGANSVPRLGAVARVRLVQHLHGDHPGRHRRALRAERKRVLQPRHLAVCAVRRPLHQRTFFHWLGALAWPLPGLVVGRTRTDSPTAPTAATHVRSTSRT